MSADTARVGLLAAAHGACTMVVLSCTIMFTEIVHTEQTFHAHDGMLSADLPYMQWASKLVAIVQVHCAHCTARSSAVNMLPVATKPRWKDDATARHHASQNQIQDKLLLPEPD